MFPIIAIPPDAAEFSEQMGTKFKFWYTDPQSGLCLFKEGRPGTGENWAEKLAGELAQLLGIPHAVYELAQWQGRFGIMSPLFVPEFGRLIHGNELVGGKVTVAHGDKRLQFYAQRSHTASRVLSYLKVDTDFLKPPQSYVPIQGIDWAIDIFVGYLLFDAWIANQDRHSENWGVVRTDNALFLAPSYDHGSSLSRHETDERRKHLMTTRDRGGSIEAYVRRARSALYPNAAGDTKVKPYLTTEAFEYAWKLRPDAGNVWRERLESISLGNIWDAINQVPKEHMSDVTREFTARLLQLNSERLIALKIS